MRYVKPDYYDKFRCIADKCPESCCVGWQIVIDKESLDKYAECKGKFGDRLKNSIDWQEDTFLQRNRRCSMLNDNNLCDLVIEKGEGWLCKTCDRYPRHTEEFDGVRELSLSLSCPVVAEMLLKREEKVSFVAEEDETEDPLATEFEDFDFLLFTQLEDARPILFGLVQNRELTIENRMLSVLELAGKLQACLDEERYFEIQEVIDTYVPDFGNQNALGEVDSFYKTKEGFKILFTLEHLQDNWEERLAETQKVLYEEGCETYKEVKKEFRETCITQYGAEKWEIFSEQILMFFLYTYFCGAVYDQCIYSKAALAVFFAYFLRELMMGEWLIKGKQLSEEDGIRLAYLYAREVEHSDINLNLLEETFMDYYDKKK